MVNEPSPDRGKGTAVNILSGGAFCLAAELAKRHGLRAGAGPFDWLFCPVSDLVAILEDNFAQFLNPNHYRSIPTREGRPSCLHALYGEWNVDRPLFNHKDPTTTSDYAYYRHAVDRFRISATDGAILFIIDEGSEIDTQFDALVKAVDRHYPRLVIRALRHRLSDDTGATLIRLTHAGSHELWQINGSSVIGGVKLQRPEDERLIVDEMLRIT